MEKFKKEIPFLAIALLPFVYLAYIWNSLPENVPMHWNLSGEIDRYGHKSEIFGLVALICGITYVLFLAIPYLDPKQKLQQMGNKLTHFRLILSVFMSGLAIYLLYSIRQQSSDPAFLFVIIGLLFAFMGNYFKTLKPNYFIGIRTPWTLENEEVWKKTHLLGGKLWFVSGLLMALTFLISPGFQLYFFLGLTAIICIIPVAYSYLEYRKIKHINH